MLEWIIGVPLALLAVLIAGLVWFSWTTARKVEALLPPKGKFVEVDGARLHYVEKGEGAPVVMIHGLGGNLLHYTSTIADEIAKTNRVIIFDRPGAGYSERPAGADATTPTQAVIIQKAIDKLGIEKPLIVGHSLGGAVALTHAVRHPGKARGYVLLAPLARLPEAPPPMFKGLAVRSPIMQHFIAWTIAVPMGIKYGPAIMSAVFAPQTPTSDFATTSGGLLGLRPKAIVTNMKDFTASAEVITELAEGYPGIEAPVLCLYGLEDRVLIASHHLGAVEKIPGVEVETIEHAGHMLMHNEPQAVIAAIRRLDARARSEPRVAAAS
jgi:pimeloyl-ACP methyl ester carboxylesterase